MTLESICAFDSTAKQKDPSPDFVPRSISLSNQSPKAKVRERDQPRDKRFSSSKPPSSPAPERMPSPWSGNCRRTTATSAVDEVIAGSSGGRAVRSRH